LNGNCRFFSVLKWLYIYIYIIHSKNVFKKMCINYMILFQFVRTKMSFNKGHCMAAIPCLELETSTSYCWESSKLLLRKLEFLQRNSIVQFNSLDEQFLKIIVKNASLAHTIKNSCILQPYSSSRCLWRMQPLQKQSKNLASRNLVTMLF